MSAPTTPWIDDLKVGDPVVVRVVQGSSGLDYTDDAHFVCGVTKGYYKVARTTGPVKHFSRRTGRNVGSGGSGGGDVQMWIEKVP